MKRFALFLALLLAVTPAGAASKNYGTITTRSGKSFYDCTIVRVHPDGVSFTHRNGAAKIAFKELPASMQRELRYDPQAAAAYQREQAELRKEEQKRRQLQAAVMDEKLMQAQMAEASYFAALHAAASPARPSMSLALPGETLPTVGYQTPSWVGAPITGPAVGGRSYRSSSFSRWSRYPSGYGGGYYPMGGYSSGFGYGYPYGGYSYGGYPYGGSYGGCAPVFGQWNLGGGFHLGVGVGSYGTVLGVCR